MKGGLMLQLRKSVSGGVNSSQTWNSLVCCHRSTEKQLISAWSVFHSAYVSRTLTLKQKTPGGNLAHRESAKEIGKKEGLLTLSGETHRQGSAPSRRCYRQGTIISRPEAVSAELHTVAFPRWSRHKVCRKKHSE